MYYLCQLNISNRACIGNGFMVRHGHGLYIGGTTRIGNNCDVGQNVTLGGNYSKVDEEGNAYPQLGNNVSIGAGAQILGPVKIGSNSIVGANSVVTRDVPEGVIVQGIPAYILKKVWDSASGRHL